MEKLLNSYNNENPFLKRWVISWKSLKSIQMYGYNILPHERISSPIAFGLTSQPTMGKILLWINCRGILILNSLEIYIYYDSIYVCYLMTSTISWGMNGMYICSTTLKSKVQTAERDHRWYILYEGLINWNGIH